MTFTNQELGALAIAIGTAMINRGMTSSEVERANENSDDNAWLSHNLMSNGVDETRVDALCKLKVTISENAITREQIEPLFAQYIETLDYTSEHEMYCTYYENAKSVFDDFLDATFVDKEKEERRALYLKLKEEFGE